LYGSLNGLYNDTGQRWSGQVICLSTFLTIVLFAIDYFSANALHPTQTHVWGVSLSPTKHSMSLLPLDDFTFLSPSFDGGLALDRVNKKLLTRVKTCHPRSIQLLVYFTRPYPLASSIKSTLELWFLAKMKDSLKFNRSLEGNQQWESPTSINPNPNCSEMSNTIGSALWVIKLQIFCLFRDFNGNR
jgi:hypothetical protein